MNFTFQDAQALQAIISARRDAWEFIVIEDTNLRKKVYAEFKKENGKAKKIFHDNTLYTSLKLSEVTSIRTNNDH